MRRRARNKLESCYLRPLTWIGDQKLGVSPKGNKIHLMVAAWPWGAYLWAKGMKRGIRVKVSSYAPPRQHHDDTGQGGPNYTNSIPRQHGGHRRRLRRGDAARRGGLRPEGAGENLFVVKGGVVYTPGPVGRRAQRHHAQHGLRDLQ